MSTLEKWTPPPPPEMEPILDLVLFIFKKIKRM